MNELTLNKYQELASRTLPKPGVNHVCPLPDWESPEQMKRFCRNVDIIHGALKLCSELGELVDPFAREMFYGKMMGEKEIANIREEMGDLLWYIAAPLCRALGCSLGDIATENVSKLKKRYPAGFEDWYANARLDKVEEVSAFDPLIEGWKKINRLRTDLTHEQKLGVMEVYGKAVDFADGFYWHDDEKIWKICPACWEPKQQSAVSEKEADFVLNH